MIPADKLLCTFFAGCAVGLCGGILVHDWSLAAHAGEKSSCRDKPDTAAYYARKPGEAHNVEQCVQVQRHGDPRWVPILNEPTIAGQGVKGKPGLEQQLTYVRAECGRLAKQLKQRC